MDLDRTGDETLSAPSVPIEEAGAEITHDPLPSSGRRPQPDGHALAEPHRQRRQVRRPGEAPRVHIAAAREDGLWRFTVTDNGIGIPPEYAEKIFVIFQRLHTKDVYSGSGIGLAMRKKIVEFHGGAITIDPDYRDGARITFTLAPEPPPDPRPVGRTRRRSCPRRPTPGADRGPDRRPPAPRSGDRPRGAPETAQRRPAKRSFSGTGAPVVSLTRTKVSRPMSEPNLSLPILRKKMFSP
ncbi:Adaptive-response sensory-kinase SasA [Streptomyces californicus]